MLAEIEVTPPVEVGEPIVGKTERLLRDDEARSYMMKPEEVAEFYFTPEEPVTRVNTGKFMESLTHFKDKNPEVGLHDSE